MDDSTIPCTVAALLFVAAFIAGIIKDDKDEQKEYEDE